ncbi:MAG: hypothetical protein ACK6DQ_13715, partial [Planctomycetota bacterium]
GRFRDSLEDYLTKLPIAPKESNLRSLIIGCDELPPKAPYAFFSNRFPGFLPMRAKTASSSEVTYLL